MRTKTTKRLINGAHVTAITFLLGACASNPDDIDAPMSRRSNTKITTATNSLLRWITWDSGPQNYINGLRMRERLTTGKWGSV